MQVIAGLGNHGDKYANTYHNIGYLVIDRFAKTKNIDLSFQKKFKGLFAKINHQEYNYCLLKPFTFMNRSGDSIILLLNYFKINLEDLLVVYDDLDLPLGVVKYKQKGGHGGHNGIKSIINSIGSNQFPRIKIGIGRIPYLSASDYVLSKISKPNELVLSKSIDKSLELIEKITSKQSGFS